MKLKAILQEEGAVLTYNMLNSLQRSVVRKIADGRLNLDNLTPAQWQVVDSVQDLGLVNSDYTLTDKGVAAAHLHKKYGSPEAKRAGVRDRKLGRTGGMAQRFTGSEEGDDVPETEAGGFQDQWGSVRDRDD